MLQSLVNGLLDFFIAILKIILLPLNTFLIDVIPDFMNFTNVLNNFFNLINADFIPWFKDSLLLPQWFITFIVTYIIMKLLAPLAINGIKLIIRWWEALI